MTADKFEIRGVSTIIVDIGEYWRVLWSHSHVQRTTTFLLVHLAKSWNRQGCLLLLPARKSTIARSTCERVMHCSGVPHRPSSFSCPFPFGATQHGCATAAVGKARDWIIKCLSGLSRGISTTVWASSVSSMSYNNNFVPFESAPRAIASGGRSFPKGQSTELYRHS
jgi:hypothetical protein